MVFDFWCHSRFKKRKLKWNVSFLLLFRSQLCYAPPFLLFLYNKKEFKFQIWHITAILNIILKIWCVWAKITWLTLCVQCNKTCKNNVIPKFHIFYIIFHNNSACFVFMCIFYDWSQKIHKIIETCCFCKILYVL